MNIYESALKKIECDQKCKPCCINQVGIIGPTGPTGPAPDFTIGNVTTGLPGTNASVTITKFE